MHLGCVIMTNVFVIVASSLNILRSSIVLTGDKMDMNCSVTGSGLTTWTYTSWNPSTEREIYSGVDIFDSVKSRYKIDKRISGQHNLIIDSVDLAHAGRYKCTSGIQKTLRTDIQLIVSGSHPVCASNISESQHAEEEHRYLRLYLWCSLNYTGNANPVFTWTKSSEQQKIGANTTTSGSGKEPLTSTSSIKEQLHFNGSGVVFHCRITCSVPDQNIINDIEYNWNYTLYGPRNLNIAEYEDRLECFADGNPTPIYRWIDVDSNISTNGPVYTKHRTMKKEHTLQCKATNIFGAESKNYTLTGRLTNSCTTPVVQGFPITALVIGGSLLCFLVMAVMVLCVVHRKRQKDTTSHRPDVALHTGVRSYDDIALSSERSPNNIMKGDRLPGKSGVGTTADNAVYAQVMKPKGPSKGNKGGNIGESSKLHHTPQDVTGADGTVYAELSGVKPPDRKGKAQVPKTPAFNKVEIYASIDHCGNASAPPLPPK